MPRSNQNRFRCKVGQEWKNLDDFSQSQQKLIQRERAAGGRIDPAHSGMTCKAHAPGGNRTELTCDLCGLVKPIDQFSRSSRKRESPECKRCVAWTETQEPDVTPAALETGHIAFEETSGRAWDDADGSADYFDGFLSTLAPITSLSQLELRDDEVSSNVDLNSLHSSSGWSGDSSSRTGTTWPTETNGTRRTSVARASSTNGSVTGPGKLDRVPQSVADDDDDLDEESLPPHMRGRATGMPRKTGRGSVSTVTTARQERKENHPTAYNAWDSNGVQHQATKAWTTQSDKASTILDEPIGENDGMGTDWPVLGETEPVQLREKGKGKWPKASEMKLSSTQLRNFGQGQLLSRAPMDPSTERKKNDNWDSAEVYDY